MKMLCELDGNALCVHGKYFRNLQESFCEFLELSEEDLKKLLKLEDELGKDENREEEYREILVHLMEECSEVIKVCSKILRFGPYNFHPDDEWKTPNHELLRAEIKDVLDVLKVHTKFCQGGKDEEKN